MKQEAEVVTHSQLLGRRVINISYLRVEMETMAYVERMMSH